MACHAQKIGKGNHHANTVDRITFNPNVMGDKSCIRGMRLTVGMIVGLVTSGRDNKEILVAYP